MIQVNEVVKTFDGFRALDGVTMTVETGSIYGLVGPNGAGKSTILRHITGVYRPDSGSVLADGQPVYENPAVKQKIAVIPDELYYFLSASTRDMMRFYRGLYPRFDDKRYEALREAFPEVDDRQPIRRLSKGMQKQSAFWLALCCQPELLVLDEPFSWVDLPTQELISELFRELSAAGTSILVVLHETGPLTDDIQRAVVLDHGRVVHDGAAADRPRLHPGHGHPEDAAPLDQCLGQEIHPA